MRRALLSILRTTWRLVFVISILANFALGVLNFVLQPMWRAAAVTSAVAATKARGEVSERQAVAKTKSKEKAKARLRRVVVAAPVLGMGAAAGFEYADYQAWLLNNPEGDIQNYSAEVIATTSEVSDEVLGELHGFVPEWFLPNTEQLIKTYDDILSRFPSRK